MECYAYVKASKLLNLQVRLPAETQGMIHGKAIFMGMLPIKVSITIKFTGLSPY